MRLTVERTGETVRIKVSGPLNMETSPLLRSALSRAGEPGVREVVADLGRTRRVETSGVATLAAVRRELARKGLRLRITGLKGPALEMFALTSVGRSLCRDGKDSPGPERAAG